MGAIGASGNSAQSGSGYVFDLSGALGNQGYIYCSGGGSYGGCPCGTTTATGQGCANTTHAGAQLRVAGDAYFSSDTLQFEVNQVLVNKRELLIRGDQEVHIPAGDGVLCTSGGSQRSQVQLATGGVTTFTHFNGGLFGSIANMGSARRFQFWYRDPANACSGAGFNFSNAWALTYLP
jgi:hypothetical protein